MRKADNLLPSSAVVTKSGNLNFLEPSGPVQACNGTALPLVPILFTFYIQVCYSLKKISGPKRLRVVSSLCDAGYTLNHAD